MMGQILTAGKASQMGTQYKILSSADYSFYLDDLYVFMAVEEQTLEFMQIVRFFISMLNGNMAMMH